MDGIMGGAAAVHGGRGGACSAGKTEEAVQEAVGTRGKRGERVKDVK